VVKSPLPCVVTHPVGLGTGRAALKRAPHLSRWSAVVVTVRRITGTGGTDINPPLQMLSFRRSTEGSRPRIPGYRRNCPLGSAVVSPQAEVVQLSLVQTQGLPCRYSRAAGPSAGTVPAIQRPPHLSPTLPQIGVPGCCSAGDLRAHAGQPHAQIVLTTHPTWGQAWDSLACPASGPDLPRIPSATCRVACEHVQAGGAPPRNSRAPSSGQFCPQSRVPPQPLQWGAQY